MNSPEQIPVWLKKYTTQDILGPWTYVVLKDLYYNGQDQPVLQYDDHFHIDINEHEYSLVTENHEQVSQDLCELEYMLAKYRLEGGFCPSVLIGKVTIDLSVQNQLRVLEDRLVIVQAKKKYYMSGKSCLDIAVLNSKIYTLDKQLDLLQANIDYLEGLSYDY